MGLQIDPREWDEETVELLHIWHDWEEFDIKPWRVLDEPDGVLTYYKNAIRHINGIYNQAEANKNKGRGAEAWIEKELQKQGKQPRKRR
jgi:hypothetical protein